MLFSVGFVANLIIGGITGVFLAAIPIDILLHDTYYVVGHFHYFLMGGTAYAVFAGIYYWFPLVTGRMYQKSLAKWHFWLTNIGVQLTFFAMLILGYLGMPRRYATYEFNGAIAPLAEVTTLHQIATIGAFFLLFAQLLWVWNMVQSYIEGPTVEDGDPWNLKEIGQHSREFQWFEDQVVRTDGSGELDERSDHAD
jgi:cytochrome c oxidase subunit 1